MIALSPFPCQVAAAIGAYNGAYNGANLARLAEPHFGVLIYAFMSLRCALRRYHPFYAPIAILMTIVKVKGASLA